MKFNFIKINYFKKENYCNDVSLTNALDCPKISGFSYSLSPLPATSRGPVPISPHNSSDLCRLQWPTAKTMTTNLASFCTTNTPKFPTLMTLFPSTNPIASPSALSAVSASLLRASTLLYVSFNFLIPFPFLYLLISLL